MARAPDHVDELVGQWRAERPDLDLDAMATFGRLGRVMAHAGRSIEEVFARHGLNVGEFDVLAALRRSGEPFVMTPTDLARLLMLSPGGMTNRLDRLEAAGHIARRADPDDRRSSLVVLTPGGRQVVDAAVADHVENEARLLDVLSTAERAGLDRALRRLLARFRVTMFSRRPKRTSTVVSPTGTYTDVQFPPTADGYDQLGWDLTIRTDPSPDGYFWSHQFGLVGGEQGYCGLQTHNAELGGPIAIFSIWKALDAVGPGWAGPFGGEGTGWSARIPYRWRTDVEHHLSVERSPAESGDTWWHATVTDRTTDMSTTIGSILVTGRWGGIAASSVMWTERYAGPMRRCGDLRHAAADFTHPTTDRGRVEAVRLHDHLANPVTCPNSRLSSVPGGSRHEMGIELPPP